MRRAGTAAGFIFFLARVGVVRAYQTIKAALFAFRQVLGALPLLKGGLDLSFKAIQTYGKEFAIVNDLSLDKFDFRACCRDHPPFFEIRVIVVVDPLHLLNWSQVTVNTGSSLSSISLSNPGIVAIALRFQAFRKYSTFVCPSVLLPVLL